MHINSKTSIATANSPTTVKMPATAPVLAKKLFGDPAVEVCAIGTTDDEVCGSCPNVEARVTGGISNVVTADGNENMLEVEETELDEWVVDIDDGRTDDMVDVDVETTTDGLALLDTTWEDDERVDGEVEVLVMDVDMGMDEETA